MMRFFRFATVFAIYVTPAFGAEPGSPQAVYQDAMRAQYDAQQAVPPIRSDEAARIRDEYLRSIGQPSKDASKDSSNGAGTILR